MPPWERRWSSSVLCHSEPCGGSKVLGAALRVYGVAEPESSFPVLQALVVLVVVLPHEPPIWPSGSSALWCPRRPLAFGRRLYRVVVLMDGTGVWFYMQKLREMRGVVIAVRVGCGDDLGVEASTCRNEHLCWACCIIPGRLSLCLWLWLWPWPASQSPVSLPTHEKYLSPVCCIKDSAGSRTNFANHRPKPQW